MRVVPVKVSHSKSKKEFSTHAMLDNCSQGTFIKEDVKKNLEQLAEKLILQSKLSTENRV